MKTTKSITVAIAATCILGASALADQQSGQNPMREKQARQAQNAGKTWDSEKPMALRIAGYPFVFLERTGHTLMRSPEIVSETFKGERPLVSKRGILAAPEKETGGKVASAPAASVTNRRG